MMITELDVEVMLMFVADLAAVDSLQSTAWDYACVRQLHYCMLIIASYLRQTNGNSLPASGTLAKQCSIDVDVPVGSSDEHLAINTLQVLNFGVSFCVYADNSQDTKFSV